MTTKVCTGGTPTLKNFFALSLTKRPNKLECLSFTSKLGYFRVRARANLSLTFHLMPSYGRILNLFPNIIPGCKGWPVTNTSDCWSRCSVTNRPNKLECLSLVSLFQPGIIFGVSLGVYTKERLQPYPQILNQVGKACQRQTLQLILPLFSDKEKRFLTFFTVVNIIKLFLLYY